jgi:CheY-like chemotaxis protein
LLKPIDWDRLTITLQRLRPRPQGSVVLVVEDDPSTREMLRRSCERQAWVVREASNGRIGLEQVLREAPDLILLDLMMPEMDGFTFVEELRTRPEYRHIPVIVITAKDLTPEDRHRLNGQVIRILQKGGYSTAELLQEMRTVLEANKDLAGHI